MAASRFPVSLGTLRILRVFFSFSFLFLPRPFGYDDQEQADDWSSRDR